MSRFLLALLLAIVLLVSCSTAAPSEDKEATKTTAVAEKVEKTKSSTADDRQATEVEASGWSSFLTEGQSGHIIWGSVATILLVGGFALAFYYFYYLNYVSAYSGVDTYSGYSPASNQLYSYGAQQGYYPSAARALSTGSSFNFARVLDMIAMAQETYEKFDFQSLDCQKKALCELQQKQQEFGETGRKISNTFSFMDALEGLPMPSVIQTYLKEYKEAILQGKNSSKECAAVYPKCGFSIKEVFVKYSKKAKN